MEKGESNVVDVDCGMADEKGNLSNAVSISPPYIHLPIKAIPVKRVKNAVKW